MLSVPQANWDDAAWLKWGIAVARGAGDNVRGSGSTTGTGAYLTLWQKTVEANSSLHIGATVIGRGTTGGASYELAVGVQNLAGVVTIIGGSFQTTFSREDNAAMDAKFDVTGAVLSLQVRDDAAQAMNWTSWVSLLGAT